MQNQLDDIKIEVTKRLHDLFMKKFEGNKLKFAKAAGCNEKAIRLIFDEGQGVTLNLLFKLTYALDITPSQLLEGLQLKSSNQST